MFKTSARWLLLPVLAVLPLSPALGQNQPIPAGKKEPFTADEVSQVIEAKDLAAKAAKLANERKYKEAEPFARKALDIRLKIFGENHLAVEQSLYTLAMIYRGSGRLPEAEQYYKRSLKVRESFKGKDSLEAASVLYALGVVNEQMSRWKEAEAYHRRGLEIREGKLGPDHLDTAASVGSVGAVYVRQRRYAEAEPLLKRSLKLREDRLGKDHPIVASVLSDFIRLRVGQRRLKDAVGLCERFVQIHEARLGADNPQLAFYLHQLGDLNGDVGRLKEAEAIHLRGLKLCEAKLGPDHPEVAVSLEKLGSLLEASKRLAEAETAYRRALKIRQAQQADGLDAAQLHNKLGSVYKAMSQLKEAETQYRHRLQILEKRLGNDHAEVARCSRELGLLYLKMGRFNEANPHLETSLRVQEKLSGKDHLDLTAPLYDLAKLRRAQGLPRDALAFAERNLRIFVAHFGQEHLAAADMTHLLGLLYSDLGSFQEAEAHFVRALKIREAKLEATSLYVAQSLGDLGLLYAGVGRSEEGEKLMLRCLKIREKRAAAHPEELEFTATTYLNLAGLYYRVERKREAEDFQRRAMAVWEDLLAKHPEEAIYYDRLGSALNNQAIQCKQEGRFEAAEALYLRSLKMSEKCYGPDYLDRTVILFNLASLYRMMGKYQEAEELLLRVQSACEKRLGPDSSRVGGALMTQALIKQATGQSRQAVALFERSMQIQDIHVSKILAVSSERDMISALASSNGCIPYGITMAAGGEKDALVPSLTWFLRRQGMVFDTLFRFRQAQGLLSPADPLAPSVKRYRQLQNLFASTALSPPKDLSAEQFVRQRAAWQTEADALQAEINRALAQRFPEQTAGGAAIDFASLRKALPAGSACVLYASFGPFDFRARDPRKSWLPGRYFAFLVTPDSDTPKLIDLGPEHIIHKAVAAVRAEFDKGQRLDPNAEEAAEEEYRTAAKALYQLVFARLRPELGKATTIYLVPQGELARVPFEALVDDQQKYLIESYRFAYQSAGRDLLRARPAQTGKGTVVFAGPDYDLTVADRREKVKGVGIAAGNGPRKEKPAETVSAWRDLRSGRWRALKGAAAEADDVRQSLEKSVFAPVQVFAGGDALEETFKDTKSPRILHVATHGFFLQDRARQDQPPGEPAENGFGAARGMSRLKHADNPLLRSGLILAGANMLGDDKTDVDDGWVTAAEIALMDLRGTELVVLSACETGLGKEVDHGDGGYGLRRAFLYAGARSLITSLFVVPDAQTRELMQHFYANLKGKGKLASLHDAQVTLIQQRRQAGAAAHPFFWASFVLVGDPE